MIIAPAELLVATVWHRRLRPKPHAFRYPAFYLLIDLAQLEEVRGLSPILSANRFNLISFHEKDHGGDGTGSLQERISDQLANRFGGWRPHRILLLAMPRCLGFAFNPLSIYYAYEADGTLGAILYEVRNTFGAMHTYIFRTDDATVRHGCAKDFHVSPFFQVEGGYDFQHRTDERSLDILINYRDPNGTLLFSAGLNARRHNVKSLALLKQIIRMPLASVGVVAAIHFEALRLWLKRLPIFTRPGKAVGPASTNLATKDGGH